MIIPLCRLSIFGDFRMLEPTSSNVVSWSQTLQNEGYEMLPNVMQPIKPVFLPPGVSVPPQFIQFAESNKIETRKLLRLTNQRIDAECLIIESETWQETLKSVLPSLLKLLHTSIGFTENTLGTRLAYYADVLIKEPDAHGFQDFYRNSNFGISFGNAGMTECSEWTHRFNQNMPLPTATGEERCNLILLMESSIFQTVSSDTLNAVEYQGLHVSTDLNTLSENDVPRFSINDMDMFCSATLETHIDILQRIMELLKR